MQDDAVICYMDEVMFTVRTVNKREFSNRYQNVTIDFKRMHIQTTAVAAAFSMEHGLLALRQYPKSLNIDKFHDYLKLVRKRLRKRKCYMFFDNLSVHRSKKTIENMRKLNIVPIFNVAYAPQYNPAELCYAFVKREYKNLNTNAIANWQPLKTKEWIDHSFEKLQLV